MQILTLTISFIATLITAIALLFTIRSFKKQLQLQFFSDYTKRYQEIILNFPEDINQDDFEVANLEKSIREKTLRYMRAYFDLCSEEYFLWKKRHIENDTWLEWKSGIYFALSKPAFQQAWEMLQLNTIYYSDFTEFIKGHKK